MDPPTTPPSFQRSPSIEEIPQNVPIVDLTSSPRHSNYSIPTSINDALKHQFDRLNETIKQLALEVRKLKVEIEGLKTDVNAIKQQGGSSFFRWFR